MVALAPLRTEVVWRPQPGPQEAAIACPIDDLFYGGSRGGGKSDYLLGDFAIHADKYGPNAHGIVFRRTYAELEELEKRANQVYPKLGATYNSSKHTWTFRNGATLKLRYLEKNKHANRYIGHQYTWMGVDQAEQFPSPEPLDLLLGCLRSAAGVPCVRRMTGNPGGVGHHWLKQRYITPAKPFTPHRYQPQPATNPELWITAVFIPAKLEDNQLLMRNDPGYEKRIAAATQGNAAMWQAWRYGNWDVISGAMFSAWRSDLHVLKTFTPPASWTVCGGMDAGIRAPSWLGLAVRGPDGDIIVCYEWYWKNKDFYTAGYEVGMSMRGITDLAIDRNTWISADSEMFSQTGIAGLTTAVAFQKGLVDALGAERAPVLIAVSKSSVDHRSFRRGCVALVRQLLHWEADEAGNVPPHKRPKLRIHNRCGHLIRTLPALPISDRDPEDVDTEAEDHPFDGLKYLIVADPPIPEHLKVQKHDENRHPGRHKDGRRRNPQKPWQDAQAEEALGLGGFSTGMRYSGYEMGPADDN